MANICSCYLCCFISLLKVCPTFGAPLIKRVLDYFEPDEFCPDPIPDNVLEALDSEVSQLNLHFFSSIQKYFRRIAHPHVCMMIMTSINACLLVLPRDLRGMENSGPKLSTMVLYCILASLLHIRIGLIFLCCCSCFI